MHVNIRYPQVRDQKAWGMSAMQFYNSVGIAEDLERMIKLYPNPTQGLVTLDLGLIEVSTLP